MAAGVLGHLLREGAALESCTAAQGLVGAPPRPLVPLVLLPLRVPPSLFCFCPSSPILAHRTWNSRVLAHPAAIYYAHDTAGVAAACFCAHAWGVRVSPASGRQGLQGGAAQDGALLLDVSNMTEARRENELAAAGAQQCHATDTSHRYTCTSLSLSLNVCRLHSAPTIARCASGRG